MIGLGFGLLGASYWLATYGWSQVRGCNAGFVSLGWPGSFKGCNPDAGSTPAPTPSPTTTASKAPSGNTMIPIGGGRSVPAKDIPGGKGSEVSP